MNKNKELELVSIDPIFFQNYHADPRQSCMAFGIECDDGWFVPLLRLIKKIKVINVACKQYGCKIIADQIKEKFGELRVYYSVHIKDENLYDKDFCNDVDILIDDSILIAEEQCWDTCEICGSRNSKENPVTSTSGWIKRVCDQCLSKRNN